MKKFAVAWLLNGKINLKVVKAECELDAAIEATGWSHYVPTRKHFFMTHTGIIVKVQDVEDEISLDDILNEYIGELTAEEGPTYKVLERWVERFPQYKDELVEFTANWSKWVTAPKVEGPIIDKALLVRKAMNLVEDIMERKAKE